MQNIYFMSVSIDMVCINFKILSTSTVHVELVPFVLFIIFFFIAIMFLINAAQGAHASGRAMPLLAHPLLAMPSQARSGAGRILCARFGIILASTQRFPEERNEAGAALRIGQYVGKDAMEPVLDSRAVLHQCHVKTGERSTDKAASCTAYSLDGGRGGR